MDRYSGCFFLFWPANTVWQVVQQRNVFKHVSIMINTENGGITTDKHKVRNPTSSTIESVFFVLIKDLFDE